MSYSCDGTYDVYHEIRVIARKPHECDSALCSDPIRPGDGYWRIQIVFDGRAETIKRCLRCQELHVHLRGKCSEAGDWHDSFWPDERLACGLEYEDEWGELPAEIAALAFWKPGEKLPANNSCFDMIWNGTAMVCNEYYFWRMNKTTGCTRWEARKDCKSPCTSAEVWQS